jgi:hypothetical protein
VLVDIANIAVPMRRSGSSPALRSAMPSSV